MKKIILTTSLFFCLAITIVLAQVATINIAAPNSSGLSSHSVADFDVNTDGTILNNSAVDGTAQLGNTAVTGNSNITAGSEAELILFQVTGRSARSDLDGTIEVFGGEAGLIIANPNGITCDGCAFINTNRVDLVVGSGYDANTNTFGTITDRFTVGSGGLDASSVAVLNIQGDSFFNNSGATINANDFNVTVVDTHGRFYNQEATINADNFNVTLTGYYSHFYNRDNATINADNFNVSSGGFSNYENATINADNFTVTAGFSFYNQYNSTINADNFNVTAGKTFENSSYVISNIISISAEDFVNDVSVDAEGNISANIFALSIAGDFDYVAEYLGNGTITTNTLNLQVDGDFSNNNSANDFTWGANDSLTVLGSADITADSFNNSGNINANSFNVTATDLTNAGTISANTTLNTTVSSTVSGSFTNTGELDADIFTLNVAGDFDYLNNGTITADTITLNVGGDFSNNDSANDFTWGANDILTVLGSASVVADSFNNSGNINANSFDITATDLTNSGTISANTTLNTTVSSTVSGSFTNTGGVLNSNTFALSVGGDFDYVADFNGTITTNSFNLNVGGDFSNNDSANDFTWDANDTLTVLGSASVVADSFENSGTIIANNFNATVNTFVNEASATITAASCDIVHTTSYTDNGTVTCLDSATGDATVINIARTLSNGISNNSYATFHIPSNGVIFNNSVSDATSQLAGFISANPNYANGNAATLILAQITGNNISSLLFGALEVFGAEAGVIIANPNGIICNACSFPQC